jgi:hypothetical protein
MDLDIEDTMELYFTATMLHQRLLKREVPHYIWDSGGKGYHFQIWLEAPEPNEMDWQQLRSRCIRELTHGILYRTQSRGNWHWNIDPRKWNWDARGAGSVVRAEGGRKNFSKWFITELYPPDKRPRKSRPTYPPPDFKFETWKVPAHLLLRPTAAPKVEVDPKKLFTDVELPICIESLIEQEVSGVHLTHPQRVVVVAHLWVTWKAKHPTELMTDKDMDEIHKIFVNDPVYNYRTTAYQIRNVINALESDPKKRPGCTYMINSGLIDNELCPICKMLKSKSVREK